MSERLQSPLPSLTHCVPRTGVQINTAHHIHSTQLINIQSAPSHTFPSPKMAKPGNPPHALCPSVPTSNPSGKPVSSITQRDRSFKQQLTDFYGYHYFLNKNNTHTYRHRHVYTHTWIHFITSHAPAKLPKSYALRNGLK